ncbi:MAG: hypothetical protein O3A91_03285 [Proteobacteria bacterium]|nr:hypothetical protein [Pseudomonadota bacterium]
MEQLNAQGMVVRKIDPQASAADQATKAKEAGEKKKRDSILKEESRKNKALLSTYTSEADIELARKRALEDNQRAVQESEARVGTLKKPQADLTKELAFFPGQEQAAGQDGTGDQGVQLLHRHPGEPAGAEE